MARETPHPGRCSQGAVLRPGPTHCLVGGARPEVRYFEGRVEVKRAIDEMVGRTAHLIGFRRKSAPKFTQRSSMWKWFRKSGRGFVCSYCMTPLTKENRTFDHVLPSSKGGVNSKSNLVAACSDCNRIKNNDELIFYLFRRRTLDSVPQTQQAGCNGTLCR